MKNIFRLAGLLSFAAICACTSKTVTLTEDQLRDKIKGGWAGQMIGVCYGQPTEFRFRETMIPDSAGLVFNEDIAEKYYFNDDIYMDLTFVKVFEEQGLDAPVSAFAKAFAEAPYSLWHANQEGRVNILDGMDPHLTGLWRNNPHADDIDFQIESDFAGLMSPGMPVTASAICDSIGHLMNYGDGWYGGVFISSMYSLAFVENDIEGIVKGALGMIPSESRYHKMVRDLIDWHQGNPDDWKSAWRMVEEKYDRDIACPDGVDAPFNIDAVINSAYVVIGLLYGEGDFEKSIEIATRCGQDSDCNPSSVGGILGTLKGFSNIPEKWIPALEKVSDKPLYEDVTLERASELSFIQAMALIAENGGSVDGDAVKIKAQKPSPVRLEVSFPGLESKRVPLDQTLDGSSGVMTTFDGSGVSVRYKFAFDDGASFPEGYSALVRTTVDGNAGEPVPFPSDYRTRRLELYTSFDLEDGSHTISFEWLNPVPGCRIAIPDAIVFAPAGNSDD